MKELLQDGIGTFTYKNRDFVIDHYPYPGTLGTWQVMDEGFIIKSRSEISIEDAIEQAKLEWDLYIKNEKGM
jgi:hypothetical protein